MNLGEFQRPYLVMNRAINRANAFASPSTPQNAFSASLPISRPNPVPGMSINTRSLTSSSELGLSTIVYGAPGRCVSPAVTTCFGPSDPMCSHTVELPGPPL